MSPATLGLMRGRSELGVECLEAAGDADAPLTESESVELGRLRPENAELRRRGVSL